ncbi:TetR/AcrR family transcriptional regulator [Rhizobium sp. G187]|uniref:TetR/AcrR family transcriptional regulator n=1 Tax=Rhizobium sp. G187 TaxID=3451352 RepID=UPI003EE5EBA8
MTREPQGKQRRHSPKGTSRREEILVAAMRRFATDGYQNAAIGDVARDVGLSLPGLLHHYPTKVDLLLAVLEKRDHDGVLAVGHLPDDVGSFLSGLVQVCRTNVEIAEVVRAFAVLNGESLTKDHPATNWFIERSRQLQKEIGGIFEQAVLEGCIRADVNGPALATELIAVMDGLQTLWLRDPDRFDMVNALQLYVDRLARDIEVTSKKS